MDMDFRSLSYIAAIAQYQNLTRAAEALYVGQPTLSKFLAGLEAELGLTLFEKVGRRYVPTYAGERYVARAVEILRMRDSLDQEMADILKREVGVLNVAFAGMRCSYMLPIVLPLFHELHPNVRINVFEGNSDLNDRRLLAGEVDAAFYTMASPRNPKLEYIPLAREELLICAKRGHPLSAHARHDPDSPHPSLELALLKDELVLMMLPEQRTRQIVDEILRERGIHLNNVLCTGNIHAIMGLVARGYGVSFVFDTHIRHRSEALPIDCYSFGQPKTERTFVAAVRKGGYLSRYLRDFIEIVKRET